MFNGDPNGWSCGTKQLHDWPCIALSSAEAQCNEACLDCVTTAQLNQIFGRLELAWVEKRKSTKPVQFLIGSRSAVDMGFSSKLSQKTRHMKRRYLYFIEGVEKHRVFWYEFPVTQLACEGPRIVHRIPKGNHTGHSQAYTQGKRHCCTFLCYELCITCPSITT